ncbi:hypothetical protein HZA56_18080 [Candidatus Poribacteria bacterium]|nr:hypothetical protein [Candidatus Poribacteria bacterium]
MGCVKFLAFAIVTLLLLCPANLAYAQEMATISAEGNAVSVLVILSVIIFLFGLFSGHDWTLFAFRTANLDNPEYYSRYAKFSVTFLSALITWTAGRHAFSASDATRLAISYSFIVLGDIIFSFNVHSIWGVFSFALAHFLLIRRNAFGLSAWPAQGAMWMLLVAIVGGSLLTMLLVFYPKLKHNKPYFALLTGYALIMGGSLWAALTALKIGFFPHANAILIALGVTFFFLSDVCVGFYRSLPVGYSRVFATYLTWVFYAPALVLTALSSYDLNRVFQ